MGVNQILMTVIPRQGRGIMSAMSSNNAPDKTGMARFVGRIDFAMPFLCRGVYILTTFPANDCQCRKQAAESMARTSVPHRFVKETGHANHLLPILAIKGKCVAYWVCHRAVGVGKCDVPGRHNNCACSDSTCAKTWHRQR